MRLRFLLLLVVMLSVGCASQPTAPVLSVEDGTLYTALAGLLNLLAVVDVIYREPGRGKPAVSDADDDTTGDA